MAVHNTYAGYSLQGSGFLFVFLGGSLLGPHIIALLALSHFKDLKTKSLLETKFSILYMKVLVTQSRPTLCSPTDCGPPGVSVHGILQARILEWVAIPFSRIFPTQGRNPGLLHCRRTLPTEAPGKPLLCMVSHSSYPSHRGNTELAFLLGTN